MVAVKLLVSLCVYIRTYSLACNAMRCNFNMKGEMSAVLFAMKFTSLNVKSGMIKEANLSYSTENNRLMFSRGQKTNLDE